MSKPRPNTRHRCPRCEQVGDPRLCNCMERLRRYAHEAREEWRRGRWMYAGGHLANLENLLEELRLDAGVTRREERETA